MANKAPPEREHVLTTEEAALRRVATLVARESAPVEIFVAVTQEAARVLECDAVGLLRFESDETATLVAQSDTPWDPPPLGTRFTLDGENVVVRVFRTGRVARVDDWTDSTGAVGAMAKTLGVRSAVASPVVVADRLWGTILAATSRSDPLPGETEPRIARFTDLVATAIANAEARRELLRLVEEQAALRRVATLVAQQPSQEETFAAVVEAIGSLLDADYSGLVVFADDVAGTVVSSWSREGPPLPVGTHLPLDDDALTARIFRSAASVRIDEYPLGAAADIVRTLELRSSVGAPVIVEGKLWGMLSAAKSRDQLLADDAEARIAAFTELVATAISNAQARRDVQRLAEEQAALRRVATLVAQQPSPEETFAAVVEAVGSVLDGDFSGMVVFADDVAGTVVASWNREGPTLPVGTRLPLDDDGLTARIFRSVAPARIEEYAAGTAAEIVRRLELRSTVGAPVLVDGKLWGLVAVGRRRERPFAEDAEARLVAFTELVATAISNAQARRDVQRLAEQEAALRRVATLVARRDSPDVVFRAVANEARGLLGADIAALVRFESDDTGTVIAGPPHGPYGVGERVSLDAGFVVHDVRETRRPARFETDDPAAAGTPDLALGVRSAVACPILVEGALWGAVVLGSYAAPFAADTERRLDDFTELVATGISNATTRAELIASRARIVAAGDEARRRIERNLHDGTQQRLIALGLEIQRLRATIPTQQVDTHDGFAGVAQDLEGILGDLRELSHGLHPPLLSRLGLGPSVQALARRSPIPVRVEIKLPGRPAPSLETATYYVVSEGVTNAIKHSQASEIAITIRSAHGCMHTTIVDDGLGGADPSGGSGLTGLLDRVDALGGRFALDSPRGGGTRITIELPVEPTAAS